MLVHPDKNPGDEAREAFEALNEAHRQLRDRGGLVGMFIPTDIHVSASRVLEYAMQFSMPRLEGSQQACGLQILEQADKETR